MIRANINQELVSVLREMICDGKLLPGERVNEVRLASRLGVSRTPLREALIALTQEGFLTCVPRRGVFVKDLTVEELNQLYPLRGLLDPAALKMAGVPSSRQIGHVKSLNVEMARCTGDPMQTIKLDDAFHAALIAHCPNRVLLEMIDLMILRTRRYEYAYFREQDTVTIAVTEHETIVEALEQGDLQRACEALRANMETAGRPILDWLERRTSRGRRGRSVPAACESSA